MSASAADRGRHERERAARPRPARRDAQEEADRRSWIGVDLARFGARPRSRTLAPLVVLALVVALAIVALRIDLIRTRYALAERLAEQQTKQEEQRALIVRLRGLRDPSVLAALARERGYRPAERVITLPDPMPGPLPGTDPTGGRSFARLATLDTTADATGEAPHALLPPVGAGPPVGADRASDAGGAR